jgi:ABC transporter substrate binding protein (PQQ-dependent alcohol dehydrogenase system)
MIFKHGIRAALLALALPAFAIPAVAANTTNVKVGFIRAPHMRETLSILDIPAANDGIAGAELAAEDNNTTGRFLGQTFAIEDAPLPPGGDPAAALDGLIARGVSFVLADLPAPALLALAGAARDKGVLIFNTDAPEDSLREENCRANVFHIAPSYSMLADGLAQYLVWKQWKRWFLIKGSHPEDELYAAALARAAKKFGAKIVEERTY